MIDYYFRSPLPAFIEGRFADLCHMIFSLKGVPYLDYMYANYLIQSIFPHTPVLECELGLEAKMPT